MVPQNVYLLVALLSLLLRGLAAPHVARADEPLRMATDAFATTAEIEIRGMPRELAQAAIQAAMSEIYEIDRLLDPDGDTPGGIGLLNANADKGPQEVDPRVHEIAVRGLQFCIWSSGAYGPLGGQLNQLWPATRGPDWKRPEPFALRDAVGGAECNRLVLAREDALTLSFGSRFDPYGFARGFAVDRAMETLVEHGVTNAWVEIGHVWRALGPGADGNGWFVSLPPAPGAKEPLDQLWLVDQALVLLSVEDPIEPWRPIVDQRTGVPARGVLAVFTVSERAVDAQPLATVLFILGHREGQQRLGSLSPRPAVYWLLGEGNSTPLEATYHWSDLRRFRSR